MDTCAICGCGVAFAWPCTKIHPDHCHDCVTRNLTGGNDAMPHPAPQEAPPLGLSARELAAVAAYQRRVLALVSQQDLARLVTEEGET